MEYRELAYQILSSDRLDDKLFTPESLTDNNPGTSYRFDEPVRSLSMRFHKRTKEEKLPKFHEHKDADKRAICLHRFCGHELLAVEIMAQALLLFPNAPKAFRKGVMHTLKEEQGHVLLYKNRLKEMGHKFGDLPLYRHFWLHVPHIHTPSHYLSMMSLTFEMANLDFAPMYRKSFEVAGDERSAALMEQIFRDEIGHVSFGYQMLKRMHPEEDSWELYQKSLGPFLTPKRAKGFLYHEEHRKMAGLPQDWIDRQKVF